MPPPKAEVLDTDSLAKGPKPPKAVDSRPDSRGIDADRGHCRLPLPASPGNFPPTSIAWPTSLSRFPPRKGSECTSCTTTSSGSGLLSFADATAVVPAPNAPLAEDEIWDEYNDLLVGDHPELLLSESAPQGEPPQPDAPGDTEHQPTEFPDFSQQPTAAVIAETAGSGGLRMPSSIYSTDLAGRISEALEAYQNPLSTTALVSGYGDRNHSIELGKKPRTSRRSSSSSGRSAQKTRRSADSGYSQSSDDSSPLSQVNLRVGSMTVSKWLTFGHVLFSPARDELLPVVGSLKRHSILVIDGLGNDDWSFYAAETYPAATFFNLSPRAPLPPEHQAMSTFPLIPPNHHQIQYMSHTDKFPFGPESFTTVVFRFPAAAPEAHYRNIITEARRVLKPGGYLELSILDLDLNNMGTRARRAVRRLKERIHAKSPDINIGSTADVMLRLLNTKGFADIKSCRVGLPVATPIAAGTAASPRPKKDKNARKDDRSLAEMMSDESAVADESITKMVAKVGRWWYNRCYEASLGPSVNSLWSDRVLLAECEDWRTSLKLMVCYARVPDIRRMASI